MISVEHETESSERSQRNKESAQAAEKIGRGFEDDSETVAESEIGKCPDQAAHDSERQKSAKPIAACASQQVHRRTQKRNKRTTKEHASMRPIAERAARPEPDVQR